MTLCLALRGATLAPTIIDALLERANDPDAEVRAQLANGWRPRCGI